MFLPNDLSATVLLVKYMLMILQALFMVITGHSWLTRRFPTPSP
jgi:hypothetical protein